MKKSEKQLNVHPDTAGFFKRFLAYLIDFVLAVGVTFALYYSFVSKVTMKNWGGDQDEAEMSLYIKATGLFTMDESKGPSSAAPMSYEDAPKDGQEFGAYRYYLDLSWNYITEFLPGDNGMSVHLKNEDGSEWSKEQYIAYFDEELLALPKAEGASYDKPASWSNECFAYYYDSETETFDFSHKPVLTAKMQGRINDGDAEAYARLRTIFWNDSDRNNPTGAYYRVCMMAIGYDDAKTQTYYNERYIHYNMVSWAGLAVSYSPSIFLFFTLIPLCLPHGKSLGKLALGLGVVGKDGYRFAMWQRFLRPVVVLLEPALLLIPNIRLGFIAMLILMLVDYLFGAFGKRKAVLHDRLLQTQLVVTRGAVIFYDAVDEEQFANEHPELYPDRMDPAKKAELDRIAMEDSILDLSNMNKNREEAAKMTSFDEYEREKEKELDRSDHPSVVAKRKVNLQKVEEETEEEK